MENYEKLKSQKDRMEAAHLRKNLTKWTDIETLAAELNVSINFSGDRFELTYACRRVCLRYFTLKELEQFLLNKRAEVMKIWGLPTEGV